MDEIDKLYTKRPFYGQRRIKFVFNQKGIRVGRKKIATLMNKMGLETQYPKPNLSRPRKNHTVYPYLLRNRKIEKVNEAWGTDITYIKMYVGWVYLVAIIDWFSRFVVSWKISPTLDKQFCIEALEEALKKGKPQIHNSDQGSQFTSNEYVEILSRNKIKVSMDAKGRCFDNIMVERLWRTVKYEEVYLKNYEQVLEAHRNLKNYFKFYNFERPHQSLNNKTPADEFFQGCN